MVPEGVNIAELAEQLKVDGVAYTNVELAHDPALQSLVQAQLYDAADSGAAGSVGLAVVDVVPQKLADARDIAQELQNASGLDTVIVQTPVNVSAVSVDHSRAALEAAQSGLPTGLTQDELARQFYAALHAAEDGSGRNLLLALAVVAALAIVASFVALRAARK